jgi:uncharacterized protein (DUF1330 family)
MTPRQEDEMAAYVIAETEVTDPAGYEEYRQAVPATIEQYGGKYLVRGGTVESLEGGWRPSRLVVLEFESAERAREWWTSQEYSGPKVIRQKTAKAKLILVEGL